MPEHAKHQINNNENSKKMSPLKIGCFPPIFLTKWLPSHSRSIKTQLSLFVFKKFRNEKSVAYMVTKKVKITRKNGKKVFTN
jgi:hypothetical protein